MTKKIRILTSSTTNPWFNLATEDWIFRQLDPDTHTLFLWRNDETVVIGRYQNPWVECKTDKMQADKVYLARRQSGGGAVFHDLGNTNFTFLSPKAEYDQQGNFQIIINALKKLNIHAELSGRNDLLVEDRKVSGSAFKHASDRSFHHGTLLVNTNMGKLGDYLNPHPLKLKAKGIASVRSRVANLVEFNPAVNHQSICDAIVDSFCDFHQQQAAVEALDKAQLSQHETLNDFYQTMSDWDWRFGKTPEFSHHMITRFAWGIVDIHLNVKKAIITEAKLFSDALDTQLIDTLQKALLNQSYQKAHLMTHLSDLARQYRQWQEPINEIVTWIDETFSQNSQ